jgi:hypothetical protein
LSRRYHALSILVGSAHAAGDPAKLRSDLYLLGAAVARVDDRSLVLWERVPLGVLELEKAGVEDDGQEHVEEVGRLDELFCKCREVASILEAPFRNWKPCCVFKGCFMLSQLISISLSSRSPNRS